MFKVGEKVVCIDNSGERDRLELYHVYTIKKHYWDEYNDQPVIDVMENNVRWLSERFITLKKYRKEKIKKLNSI